MCEIYGFSEIDADWKDLNSEKEITAELNGSKRKVTVLPKDAKLITLVLKQANQTRNCQNQSVPANTSQTMQISPTKTDATVEVQVRVTFGGKDGPKVGGGLKGGFQNEKGSYGNVKVDYQENGEVTVEATGGYDRDAYDRDTYDPDRDHNK